MESENRAEKALKNRLARERRAFGPAMTPEVEETEYLGYDEGLHDFAVWYKNGMSDFFSVRLYAKSARVWRA